eukprot:TRINITY_DN1022_c0_g1_i1.p1 TRINITY_DN1022_c0_g1~~TRINITY_DN1022_c0_g1_i1.p1  ORF type:complete len:309 (+),score=67.01 TRINITY_DN1022_c0_g1_i1:53-928(+)
MSDEVGVKKLDGGSSTFRKLSDSPQLMEDRTPQMYVPWYLHLLRYVFGLLLFPITVFVCWRTVAPKESMIITCFGRLWKVIEEPGCYCIIPFGCSVDIVSTKQITMDLEQTCGKTTIADLNGNPVIVGAIITFQITDSVRSFFNVSNVHEFVRVNAQAALKRVVSQYPYESSDPHVPSLKNSSHEISSTLSQMLRERVHLAGVVIHVFDLSDLYYAPEIAAAMLQRQQAQATIDARKLIVSGAVEIVSGAIQGLSQKNITIAPEEAAKLAGNLLCVICSESNVQNVLPLSQ